jgi:hypothetical protein
MIATSNRVCNVCQMAAAAIADTAALAANECISCALPGPLPIVPTTESDAQFAGGQRKSPSARAPLRTSARLEIGPLPN